MEILRWQAQNPLANYQYIVCDTAQNAVLIDPLDTQQIGSLVGRFSLKVAGILVSHEHPDHAGEAGRLQKAYNVPVYSSPVSAPAIAAQVQPVHDKAEIRFGAELVFRAHHTPGHTPGHTVFEADGLLFSGDCLFHAGCGHCRSAGSNIEEHFQSLEVRLGTLNPDLLLFPGHYYARRNLDFALHVEPDNARARDLRQRLTIDADEMNHQTTLRQEREYNPFLRIGSRSLRRRVSELAGKDLTEASPLQVFRELRRLRDNW